MQVALGVAHGTLTLGSPSGLTFTAGADGTSSMTVNGTISALNAALQGLTYAPSANHTGADTLSLTTSDLVNFGAGGILTDFDTVGITVNALNDAPVNTAPGTQNTGEDSVLSFSQSNGNRISVGDVDDADNGVVGDEAVRVTLASTAGTLTLNATTGLSFSAGANGTSGMTFSGTLANVNSALDGVSYSPVANFNGSASLTMTTSDLGNFGSGGTLTDTDVVPITVDAVNDAPHNTVPGSQVTSEDNGIVMSTGNGNAVSVGDVDDADNATSGDEVMQVALGVAHGTLTLGSPSGLTFTAGADGTSSMTVNGTISALNGALQGLTYAPSANYAGADTLSMTTSDLGNFGAGGILTDFDTVGITVNALNDAPVNTAPGTQNTAEDTVLSFSQSNGNRISVGDVDDADNGVLGDEPVQVMLASTAGTLTLSGTSGLSFSAGANGTSGMTFSGTLANVNSALDGLSYSRVANVNGSAQLTITTSDFGNFGSGGNLTDTDVVPITVNAVNDAPVNTVPGTQATAENTNLVMSAGNGNRVTVGDVDDGDNAVTGDELLQVALDVSHGTLTLGGTSGLTFTAGANGTA